MEIRFDPAFVEEAVFLELKARQAAGDATTAKAFRAEWDTVYEAAPTQQDRDAGFERIVRRYFRGLGLAELIESRVAEFPSLGRQVPVAVVRRVWSRKEERVELYVAGVAAGAAIGDLPSKSVLLALMPQRCVERDQTAAYLRSELMHIADMLDPAFGYEPHPLLGGDSQTEDDLIRERFQVLWNIAVDARMRARGWEGPVSPKRRLGDFERAFGSWQPERRREVFESLQGSGLLTQRRLLDLSQDAGLMRSLGEGGVRCPLCRFPSREGIRDWQGEWAAAGELIQAEYPSWRQDQGACLQCAELFASRIRMVR
jgi:hypothetical protein